MKILTIILSVSNDKCFDEIRHTFITEKSFEYAMEKRTLQMLLDDIRIDYDNIQIYDDLEYNLFSKTLKIRAKVLY